MHQFVTSWDEDGSATVLGRLTARNGSGSATGVDGEGNWIQQADVSSITFKIFDESGTTPDVATETGTLTVSDVILDTPVTSQAIWTLDSIGYNLLHDLSNTYFPTGGNRYRVEYTVTLVGGSVFHGVYTGKAWPVRSS